MLFGSNGNSHTVCMQSDVCVYICTCSAQCRDAGRAKEIGTAVNAACQGNLSVCHFGHACHRFGSPVSKKVKDLIHTSHCNNGTGVRHSTPIFTAVRTQALSEYHLRLQVRRDLPMSHFHLTVHTTASLHLRCVRSQKSDGPAHLPTTAG